MVKSVSAHAARAVWLFGVGFSLVRRVAAGSVAALVGLALTLGMGPSGVAHAGPPAVCSGNAACYTGIEIGGAVLGMVGPTGAAGAAKAADAAAEAEKAAKAATGAADAAKAAGAATDAEKAASAASDANKAADAATDVSKGKSAATEAANACSFTGDTPVLLADGSRLVIGSVRVGMAVAGMDPGTGVTTSQTVTAVWPHEDQIWDVSLSDGTLIHSTANHPWWDVTTRTWTRTDHLVDGDQLATSSGMTITVTGVEATSQTEATYNLTVTGPHTYYVGDTEVLVHNCGPDLDALSQSGARPVNPGSDVTKAAQELDKHGGQGSFPKPTGSVAEKNQAAQDQLDDILTAPGTRVEPVTSGNQVGGTRYITPDGRGATFDANGQFIYFGVY